MYTHNITKQEQAGRSRLLSFLQSPWSIILAVVVFLTFATQIILLANLSINDLLESESISDWLAVILQFLTEFFIDIYLLTYIIKAIKEAKKNVIRAMYFEKISKLFFWLNRWIKAIGVIAFFVGLIMLFSGHASIPFLVVAGILAGYILLRVAFTQVLSDFSKEIFTDLDREHGVKVSAKQLVKIFAIQFVLSLALSIVMLSSSVLETQLGGTIVKASASFFAASTILNLYGIIYLLKFLSWPEPKVS